MTIIAIDPGKSGGIAWKLEHGTWVESKPMPATERDLVELLATIFTPDSILYLEKVGGYMGGRGQPGSAMFEFGKWAWAPAWLAMAYQVKVVMVTPQKWQKALSLGKSCGNPTIWKNKLKSRAQQLFPSTPVTLKTADALLILEAARLGKLD